MYIEGRLLSRNLSGANAVYMTSVGGEGDCEQCTVTKRVEDVALAHYADTGYPQGRADTHRLAAVLSGTNVCTSFDFTLSPKQIFELKYKFYRNICVHGPDVSTF